jgi:hypothetical protein
LEFRNLGWLLNRDSAISKPANSVLTSGQTITNFTSEQHSEQPWINDGSLTVTHRLHSQPSTSFGEQPLLESNDSPARSLASPPATPQHISHRSVTIQQL